MGIAQNTPSTAPHIPVLIDPILKAASPVSGVWLDGTFGAGGYTRAFLDAGADQVLAVDRDPEVFERAQSWAGDYGDRLTLIKGTFGNLDHLAREAGKTGLDGVVLDIGVSSMQIDQAERGFSFQQDGPLDMRMSQDGISAEDVINNASEALIADILFQYGEERASRRIASKIVRERASSPIRTTSRLSEIITSCLPRPKPGQIHPATRSFQGIRIAVNDELQQLVDGLSAAEAILSPDGLLVVVSFHSLEDRIVKRFMQIRSGSQSGGSRHAPEMSREKPQFEQTTRKAISGTPEEIEQNPRARSAKLRVARRTSVAAGPVSSKALGLPQLDLSEFH